MEELEGGGRQPRKAKIHNRKEEDEEDIGKRKPQRLDYSDKIKQL